MAGDDRDVEQGLELDDSAIERGNGGLGAVSDIEVAEEHIDMPFAGALCDAERISNLAVAQPLHNEIQNVEFTAAEVAIGEVLPRLNISGLEPWGRRQTSPRREIHVEPSREERMARLALVGSLG